MHTKKSHGSFLITGWVFCRRERWGNSQNSPSILRYQGGVGGGRGGGGLNCRGLNSSGTAIINDSLAHFMLVYLFTSDPRVEAGLI